MARSPAGPTLLGLGSPLVPTAQSRARKLARPVANARETMSRYLRSPEVFFSALAVVFIAALCFLGPYVLPVPGPNAGLAAQSLIPPFSPGHLLGTDINGNDIFSRLLYGGRVSFEIGFGAVGIGLTVGTLIGMVAGYLKGFVDALIMRCLDILLSFPALILALTILTFLGQNERNVIIAISFFTIPGTARLARAQTLRVSARDYVVAARAIGGSTRHILFRQLLPNVLPPLITVGCLQVGTAMLTEAGLSYLGLGVKIPTPTWGNMIANGQSLLLGHPALVFIPAIALFLTVVSFNLLGNGLRETLTSEVS
jgi:peptide/nickel transport system permease protein